MTDQGNLNQPDLTKKKRKKYIHGGYTDGTPEGYNAGDPVSVREDYDAHQAAQEHRHYHVSGAVHYGVPGLVQEDWETVLYALEVVRGQATRAEEEQEIDRILGFFIFHLPISGHEWINQGRQHWLTTPPIRIGCSSEDCPIDGRHIVASKGEKGEKGELEDIPEIIA